jgi:hypothetical protein
MNTTCSSIECIKPTHARGLCKVHYNRLRHMGNFADMRKMAPPNLPPAERLAFIGWDVTSDGCHEWRGSRTKDGYGHTRFNGAVWLSHRLSYFATHGPIAPGLVVRHSCDNPPCINPAHLSTGSIKANVHDSISRKRFANGERVSTHKVTDDEVAYIREAGTARTHTHAELADLFAISKPHVAKIIRGERRAKLTNPAI